MKKFIATAAALCFLAAGCGQYDPLTEEQDIPEAVEATTGDTTETTTEPETTTAAALEVPEIDEYDGYELYSDPRFIEISPETEIYKTIDIRLDENNQPYNKTEIYCNKYDDILRLETTYYNSDDILTTEYTYTYENDHMVYSMCSTKCSYAEDNYINNFSYEDWNEYNEQGLPVYTESKTDGVLSSSYSSEYNEKGDITKYVYTKYTENGEIDREQITYYEYECDGNENLIRIAQINESGDITYERINEYDENGFIRSCLATDHEHNNKIEEYYTCNEFGQTVLEEYKKYNSEGELCCESTYRNEYDPVTHFLTYNESETLDYNYNYHQNYKTYYDENGDFLKDTYAYSSEDDSENEFATSEKEYLVSDDIAEIFRSWIMIENSREVAKMLAKLGGNENKADAGAYETETDAAEETAEVTDS